MREKLLKQLDRQLFQIRLKEVEIKAIDDFSHLWKPLRVDYTKELKELKEALNHFKVRYNELTIQLTENNFKV